MKFFSFLCNRFLFCRCVVLPSHIFSQKLLKGDDDLPKERVGKIPQKCLLGLVDDEMHIGKPRQSGPVAPGKGDDLKSLLAGPCNIVQDNIGFAALRHGNHQGRRQIADHPFPAFPKDHIIVKMNAVEHRKSANGKPVYHIGCHMLGKARSHSEDLLVPVGRQQGAEIRKPFMGEIVDDGKRSPAAGVRVYAADLDGKVVKQLPIALKAKPLAKLHDKAGGNKVFAGDLLNAHIPLAALNVRDDAGDDRLFLLGNEVCQKIVIFSLHFSTL